MAEERTITTVFKADISNFSASTQQLNRYISQVNSEFKNATASMTRWNDNADGLRAKLEQLNKVHDAESRKLQDLETKYAELVEQGKENTREAQQLATAINNQSAKVKEAEKNIDFYSASLKELEDAGVDTREELEELNKAAKEAAKTQEKELAEAAKRAAEEQDKLTKELEEQEQAAKDLGGSISKGAALGIAGIGAACVGALSAASNLVEEYKELNTQMGMLETAFTEAGHSAETAKNTYNELYGVLGDDRATEAAQHLAQVAKSEEELASWTDILTGVYATFGNSLPIEGLAEAINHTAKLSGESAAVQGVLADALEWSGVNVDEFNEKIKGLNTEEERAQLINTTLNGIYGESATKYKEVNADVIEANKTQNEYNQTMAKLAEDVQPTVTEFKSTMVGALTTIMPLLTGAMNFVTDNINWLLPVMGTLTLAIVAQTAATKIKTITDLAASQGISVMTLAQKGLNAAMKANPIGLIVTAVGLLVTAFVTLWNKCEGFRNFWIGFINILISGVNALIRGLNKISVKVPDWVPEWGGKKFGFNIKEIPKLAEGGIVDKATLAMIGEAGKEVVMPLEKNTQWIDKLADKISAKGGNQSKTYNITNRFEKMETSRHALHKANLETKRILKEV